MNNIANAFTQVCHIVGCAAANLGRELFSIPGLCEALRGSLLHGISWLPEHWLRPLVRAALRPLLAHAASKHQRDIAKPLVASLAPISKYYCLLNLLLVHI